MKESQRYAVAIQSYSPVEDTDIPLIMGDVLQVLNPAASGLKAECRCLSTSCVGRCPIKCLKMCKDPKEVNFDLLVFEIQCLFDFIFKQYFTTSRPNENDVTILELVKKIQGMMPIDTNRIQVGNMVNELRSALGWKPILRNKFGNVLTSHDLTTPDPMDSAMKVGATNEKAKNSHSVKSQFEMEMKFAFNYMQDVRLSFRLVSYEIKKDSEVNLKTISAPIDMFLKAKTEEQHVVNFINIDQKDINSLALACRVFSVEKDENIDSYEYIGTAVNKLSLPKDGSEIPLSMTFYTASGDTSQADMIHNLLNNVTQEKKVEELPNLNLTLKCTENNDKAKNVTNDNTISVIGYPTNLSTSFQSNSIFVKLLILHQKSKLKKTRIVLHVLDIEKKEYISCFKHTSDPTVFPTVIQKGNTEMIIDEIAEIELQKDTDISKLFFVFEVQRPNPKGGIHLSSFNTLPLSDGNVIKETKEPLMLSLIKPNNPIMKPENYVEHIMNKGKEISSGNLQVSLSLVSTNFTTYPIIDKLLNWKEHIDDLKESTETPQQIDQTILCIFLYRIFNSLAEMIDSEQNLESFAINFFVKTLSEIDQSRLETLKLTLESYLETQFTKENNFLSNLYTAFLNYINDALQYVDNSEKGDVERGGSENCKLCCRCLSYILSIIAMSLKLNTEIKDDKAFKKSITDIFQKLGILMGVKSQAMNVSKTFICKSFPKLCDVVLGYFNNNEKITLVKNFFNSIKIDDLDEFIQSARANKSRLIVGFLNTKFFEEESTRNHIMPLIVEDLKKLKQNNFQKNIYSILTSCFFSIKGRASNLQSSISPLNCFAEDIINNTESKYFTVIYLYYAKVSSVFEKVTNKSQCFLKLLEIMLNIISSNPPTYILFISLIVFSNLISYSQNQKGITVTLDKLIEIIGQYFNEYMKSTNQLNSCDRFFFQHVYSPDFSKISKLLPKLMGSTAGGGFSASVFLPLFHFYSNQDDSATRSSVVDSFYNILQSDYRVKRSYARSENASYHAIDEISSTGNDKILELKQLFEETKKKKLICSEMLFKKLDQFSSYMYDLGRYPNQRRYEDERTTAIISILDSCRTNNDWQLYPHFSSKLYELHIMLNNKTEAAETLVDCAEKFQWNETEHIPEGHGFPEQPKCERKRSIIHKAIELFMESEFYERALDVSKILLDYYQNIDKDYKKISEIYSIQNKCYDAICNKERNILNRFYGVHYYGSKFDSYFKDLTFVYRRNGFFMNDQMMRDLKEKFPEAKVDPKPPSEEELKNKDLYYIHVFNLKPRDLDKFDSYQPPSEIMINSVCNISEFYSETPIRKRREGGYGEFAEWHRIIVTYKTKNKLQGLTRRSPIINKPTEVLKVPIECAIIDTNAKTIELMQKACMYWRCIRFDLSYIENAVSSFSMLASGIVNAAVNGGTKVFQELFLESDLKKEKDNVKNSKALKDAFADQLKAVNFALKVHDIVKSPQYADLHQNIVDNFGEMKKQMEKSLGPIDLDSPPTSFVIPPTDFFEDKIKEKTSVPFG